MKKILHFLSFFAILCFSFTACKTDISVTTTDNWYNSLDNNIGAKFTNKELNGTTWKATGDSKEITITINNNVLNYAFDSTTVEMNLSNSIAMKTNIDNIEPTISENFVEINENILYLEKVVDPSTGLVYMAVSPVFSKTFFSGTNSTIYGKWENSTTTIELTKEALEITSTKDIQSYTDENFLLGKGFEDKTVRIKYTSKETSEEFGETIIADLKMVSNGMIHTHISPEPMCFSKVTE